MVPKGHILQHRMEKDEVKVCLWEAISLIGMHHK